MCCLWVFRICELRLSVHYEYHIIFFFCMLNSTLNPLLLISPSPQINSPASSLSSSIRTKTAPTRTASSPTHPANSPSQAVIAASTSSPSATGCSAPSRWTTRQYWPISQTLTKSVARTSVDRKLCKASRL